MNFQGFSRLILLLFFIVFNSSWSASQELTDEKTNPFNFLINRVSDSFAEKESKHILAILDSAFVMTMIDGKELSSPEEVIQFFTDLKNETSHFHTLFSDFLVEGDPFFIMDTVASIRGKCDHTYTFKKGIGKSTRIPGQWNALLHYTSQGWRLVQFQISINPLDNPILDHAKKRKLWFTVGNFVLGLALGVLVMSLKTRSKS